MKILAISSKPRIFVPECCKDMETPPKFTVKSISKRQYLNAIADSSYKIPQSLLKFAESTDKDKKIEDLKDIDIGLIRSLTLQGLENKIKILEVGCTGWEDVVDSEGDLMEFAVENFEFLNEEIMDEVVNTIIGHLSETDEKNSGSPLSSLSGSEAGDAEKAGTATVVEKTDLKTSETVGV